MIPVVFLVNPLLTIATVSASILQFCAVSSIDGDTTALSKLSMAMQAATFLALAVLWLFRLSMDRKLDHWYAAMIFFYWYPGMGWACVNNAMVAIGQFGVLCTV
jgi:hypothetical protein